MAYAHRLQKGRPILTNKAADLQMLKMKNIALTVNTGHVMFSGEIYYY